MKHYFNWQYNRCKHQNQYKNSSKTPIILLETYVGRKGFSAFGDKSPPHPKKNIKIGFQATNYLYDNT